jgi:hypothetical protein
MLQIDSGQRSECRSYAVAGITWPARIYIKADDRSAAATADVLFTALDAELRRNGASAASCGQAQIDGCMSTRVPACRHLLVPIVGVAPMPAAVAALCTRWHTIQGHRDAALVPVLDSSLAHPAVFAGLPASLSNLQIAAWSGSVARLCGIVLIAALHADRPAIFLSYRRADAAALADDLFAAMNERGFRVYVDRFSATAGRPFPKELAEEVAACDAVVLIESSNIRQSKWTLWEIAFARLYRIGIIALHFPGAPTFPFVDRRFSLASANMSVSPGAIANLANDIAQAHSAATLRRTAFYEMLVAGAAKSNGHALQREGHGVLRIGPAGGTPHGFVLPVGKPGNARGVRQLGAAGKPQSATGAVPKLPRCILAGQHAHLMPAARDDLDWAARRGEVELAGRFDTYWKVKSLP